jgi:hypothetical protein
MCAVISFPPVRAWADVSPAGTSDGTQTPISSHRLLIKCSDILHWCFGHRHATVERFLHIQNPHDQAVLALPVLDLYNQPEPRHFKPQKTNHEISAGFL